MRSFTTLVLVLCLYYTSFGNNLTISGVTLKNHNKVSKTSTVSFDLSWDNSWRLAAEQKNWDAAWVFVKYQQSGSQEWHHAKLKTTGHTAPAVATVNVPADGMGAFVYRSAAGSGTFTANDLGLLWDYAANGLTDGSLVTIKVFAMEMVYVPQGAFSAGDNATSEGAFRKGTLVTNMNPWNIDNENEIVVSTTGLSSGYYYTQTQPTGGQGLTSGTEFTIPAAFPKGFNAFYSMKYEISEGQWVSFFNTLTAAQKITLDITSSNKNGKGNSTVVNRNAISWPGGSADATTACPNLACGFLSWTDAAAYADWAGLRPMTELEFEKAARGTLPAVSGEFAWGSTAVTKLASLLNNDMPTECSGTPNANANFGAGISGPARVGLFATENSNRVQAGASYWGIMDLSGNVWERVVSVGYTTLHPFIGTHGDGKLSAAGYANMATWPGATGTENEVTTAAGAGFRGGSWASPAEAKELRISNRIKATTNDLNRKNDYGFRAVRTAN